MKRTRWLRPTPTTCLSMAALIALLLLSAMLPGCGGVDSGGTGQTAEPTPTTSTGRISGFGSVIVNGVRFDDTQAVVVDDDGVVRPRSDLQLGMVVEVQGELRGGPGEGRASRIQFGHAIAGPVQALDLPAARLTVLGQPVQVDVDTLFGDYAGGLADVQVGQLVQVHAFYDSVSGVYTATRIERRASLAQYTLRGRISALQGPPARTFAIGGAVIAYGSVPPPPPPAPPLALADGDLVRVSLNTTLVSGRWVATAVRSAQQVIPENNEAELEGYVSGFAGSASFNVAGVPVDASAPGVAVQHGTLADLADGMRVAVKGRMRAGVLVAERLDFRRGGEQKFVLHGDVESVNLATQTLVVHGVTVSWDSRTRFNGGDLQRLVPGAAVEVRGTTVGGVRILAETIRFER